MQEFDKDKAREKCMTEYPERFKLKGWELRQKQRELRRIAREGAREERQRISAQRNEERLRQIILLRAQGKTLAEIGKCFCVSRERIRQLTANNPDFPKVLPIKRIERKCGRPECNNIFLVSVNNLSAMRYKNYCSQNCYRLTHPKKIYTKEQLTKLHTARHRKWLDKVSKTPKYKEYIRKRNQRQYIKIKNSPELKARQKLYTKRQKEKMRADPVRWAEYLAKMRIRNRRRYAEMMANPIKHQQYLEESRRYARKKYYSNTMSKECLASLFKKQLGGN